MKQIKRLNIPLNRHYRHILFKKTLNASALLRILVSYIVPKLVIEKPVIVSDESLF